MLRYAIIAVITFLTFGASVEARERTLTIVAGFPPGGPSTIVARHMADALEKYLGATAIVENRPGASGRIAAEHVKRQPPDGNTLLVMASTSVLKIEPDSGLVPVGRISRFDFIFGVHKDVGVKTLDQYIARVRAGEVKGDYTTPGAGSVPHLLLEQLAEEVATKRDIEKRLPLTHVPYQGSAAAVQAVIGNHVPAGMFALSDLKPALESGVVPLFIASSTRSQVLKDVPTLMELGYDLDASGWHALYVRKEVDPLWLEELRGALLRAAHTIPQTLKDMGFVGAPTSSSRMYQIHKGEYERWNSVARRIGIPQ